MLYSCSMFRRSFKSIQLLALLLPFTLFWGWAACLSVCSENTAQHEHANAAQINETREENCVDKTDDCAVNTLVAINQKRQACKSLASAVAEISTLQSHAPLSAWDALLPEVKQNSPPGFFATPLFVRHCAFLI